MRTMFACLVVTGCGGGNDAECVAGGELGRSRMPCSGRRAASRLTLRPTSPIDRKHGHNVPGASAVQPLDGEIAEISRLLTLCWSLTRGRAVARKKSWRFPCALWCLGIPQSDGGSLVQTI